MSPKILPSGQRCPDEAHYEAPLGRKVRVEYLGGGPEAENYREAPPVTTRQTHAALVQSILEQPAVPYDSIDEGCGSNLADVCGA